MSKEEKKAIEILEAVKIKCDGIDIYKTIKNLIEKQQKEIEHWKAGMKIVERDKNNHIERLEKELDNIKEIEKSHQEENGKLRVEFEKVYQDNLTLAHELKQEKEKNKELLKEYNKKLQIDWEDAISKDKIKEKLELLKDILKAKEKDGNIYKQIPIEYLKGAIEQLEELLEGK